jgi:hypothetical protein
MSDFYNDRRSRPIPGESDSASLDKASVTDANRRILEAAPAYRHAEINRKIKTTAVQRHRSRAAGQGDFDTISEYTNFIYGTSE